MSESELHDVAEGLAAPAGVLSAVQEHSPLDPAVAALCVPVSDSNPCGPDLDLAGDADYLNFLAQVEGILPTSFFSLEDGKPFDPSAVDLKGQLAAADALLARSRDIRLLVIRARLLILNRDIAGFATTVAALAEWLDRFWAMVHPGEDDLIARQTTISALNLPTVIFPLQYAPFFEGRRIGPVTYRGWMVAIGEIKPRAGEAAVSSSAVTEALASADISALTAARCHVTLLDSAVGRIRRSFEMHAGSADLDSLSTLVRRMRDFIDPHAADGVASAQDQGVAEDPSHRTTEGTAAEATAVPLRSISEAKRALAAIAEYYAHSEPSSPALPLVRQAHQLIGKSFLEIMTILVPSHVDKAAFQIGTNPVFDLPVSKLSFVSADRAVIDSPPDPDMARPAATSESAELAYRIGSRRQALVLLDTVQRYFRHTEPSSPVPMLCERARALAERDFMAVLADVLPKSALKSINSER